VVFDAPDPIELSGDSRLLWSALSNLLRNAIKFSPEGATVTVRTRKLSGRLRVEVEDECGGLPPGKADELLRPFVQGRHEQGGFGLGLAIARQAAEAHGGTVVIQDLPGKGCVVALELPV